MVLVNKNAIYLTTSRSFSRPCTEKEVKTNLECLLKSKQHGQNDDKVTTTNVYEDRF